MALKPEKSKPSHKSIYVILGKDRFLVDARCQTLLDELIEPQHRAMNLFAPDPAQVAPSDVLDELRTAPFLAESRLVLIKRADEFISKNRELLERYFDSPCPSGILVLTVHTWPANTRLARKLSKVGQLINVSQPKPRQLPQYVISYARQKYDKSLSRAAAEYLVELVGDDPGRLTSELDKLAIFTAEEKAITPAHIETLIGPNRMFNVFAAIDASLSGDVAGAVELLRRAFAADTSAVYKASGAFAFHLHRMFNARVLLEAGSSTSRIANELRIWPDRDAFFRRVRKMTLAQIGSCLEELASIDYSIKTGRRAPEPALEQFVFKLASYS